MKLSVVIICWNDWKVIEDCLRSIYAGTHRMEYEVIVSDNGSSGRVGGNNSRELSRGARRREPGEPGIRARQQCGHPANTRGIRVDPESGHDRPRRVAPIDGSSGRSGIRKRERLDAGC